MDSVKTEQSNASTERILALLILLLQGEQSREDIVDSIPAYRRGATAEAQQKMLDRDLSTLERAGLQVKRTTRLKGWTTYQILLSQFSTEK